MVNVQKSQFEITLLSKLDSQFSPTKILWHTVKGPHNSTKYKACMWCNTHCLNPQISSATDGYVLQDWSCLLLQFQQS